METCKSSHRVYSTTDISKRIPSGFPHVHIVAQLSVPPFTISSDSPINWASSMVLTPKVDSCVWLTIWWMTCKTSRSLSCHIFHQIFTLVASRRACNPSDMTYEFCTSSKPHPINPITLIKNSIAFHTNFPSSSSNYFESCLFQKSCRQKLSTTFFSTTAVFFMFWKYGKYWSGDKCINFGAFNWNLRKKPFKNCVSKNRKIRKSIIALVILKSLVLLSFVMWLVHLLYFKFNYFTLTSIYYALF